MSQKETVRYAAVQDIMIIPRGPKAYHAHWHNAAEFILALTDGCSYRVQNKEITLNRGDLLLVWPRQLHETVDAAEDGVFFIQFSDRLIENNLDLTIAMRMLARNNRISREEAPELAGRLEALMTTIRDTYDEKDPFSETRCKVLIYQMILLVADYAFQTKKRQWEEESLPDEAWERVREACAYIESHSAENIRQADVAAAVGLSVFYFSRLFRRYMQTSFPQYVAHVRVRAAAGLLGRTSLPVTECAWQAGFQSITAFNKSFLDTMGLSPRDYRKMYQNIREES